MPLNSIFHGQLSLPSLTNTRVALLGAAIIPSAHIGKMWTYHHLSGHSDYHIPGVEAGLFQWHESCDWRCVHRPRIIIFQVWELVFCLIRVT